MTEFDDSANNGYALARQFVTDRRKDVAYNALKNVYGDAAGDPDAWMKDQSAQTAQTNSEQQQQLGLITSLQGVRDKHANDPDGGKAAVSAAFDQLKPVIAQHVDPAHMQGLEQMIKTDPSQLDAVHNGFLAANPQLAKINQGQQKIDISLGGLNEKTQYHEGLLDIGQQKAATGQQRADQGFQLGTERNDIARQRVAVAARSAGAPLDDDALGFLYERDQAGDNSMLGRMSQANKAIYADYAAKRAATEGDTGQSFVYARQAAKARGTAVADLGKSSISSAGGIVRANSAAIAHLNQIKTLAAALQDPSQNATVRRVQAAMSNWAGNADYTNLDALALLAGNEAVKAVTANGGDKDQREAARQMFSGEHKSIEQINGAADTVVGGLSGQIHALRQKYVGMGATKDFDAVLTPEAKAALQIGNEEQPQNGPQTAQPAQTAPQQGAPQGPPQPAQSPTVSKWKQQGLW